MRVLLCGSAGIYGAQLSLYHLAKMLKQKGVEVLVVIPEHNEMENLYKKANIEFKVIKNGLCWYKPPLTSKGKLIYIIKLCLNYIAELRIKKIIKKKSIDIIHINSIGISIGAKSAIRANKKLVWHIREFVEEDLNRLFYNTKKTYGLVNQADCIITISKSVFNKYHNIFSNDNMVVIPNGIDETEYCGKEHKILLNEKIKIVFVGRIANEKGQWVLMEALDYLKKYHYCLEVEFIGDGNGDESECNRLKTIVKLKGWTSFVCFSGYTNQIATKLRESDICVVASKLEAFGRVTVEAMLAGSLVIGADSGGTSEILSDGRGILFDVGCAEQLAAKIQYIIEHKDEMRILAEKAQKYALEVYTAERNAEQIYQVYKKLIKG